MAPGTGLVDFTASATTGDVVMAYTPAPPLSSRSGQQFIRENQERTDWVLTNGVLPAHL
jgi:hypothetical protein